MRYVPSASTAATAASSRSPASPSPMWRSIIAADNVTPTGFARFVPAKRGAVPWVASNTAAVSPTCPPGATPSPPISPAATSDTTSP